MLKITVFKNQPDVMCDGCASEANNYTWVVSQTVGRAISWFFCSSCMTAILIAHGAVKSGE